jgi:uncharacterized phage-like protein YoqJ
MENVKTIYLTGYRSFELGIFQAKDPKITIIKKVLKSTLLQLIDEGVEWVLIAGNLGVEIWGAEVLFELQEEGYEIKLGVIFPFEDYGSQWNEANRLLLQNIKLKADYVNSTSAKPYENPSQLRSHTQFLLEHTQGAFFIYDEEFSGKTKWFFKDAKQKEETSSYFILQIDMDELQNIDENEY